VRASGQRAAAAQKSATDHYEGSRNAEESAIMIEPLVDTE
jgi:hypothetical protein